MSQKIQQTGEEEVPFLLLKTLKKYNKQERRRFQFSCNNLTKSTTNRRGGGSNSPVKITPDVQQTGGQESQFRSHGDPLERQDDHCSKCILKVYGMNMDSDRFVVRKGSPTLSEMRNTIVHC